MNPSESTKIEDIFRSRNEDTIAPYDDTWKLEEQSAVFLRLIHWGLRPSCDFGSGMKIFSFELSLI